MRKALGTALETLGSLQHEGKRIGVISHVAAVKERIGVRIQMGAGYRRTERDLRAGVPIVIGEIGRESPWTSKQ